MTDARQLHQIEADKLAFAHKEERLPWLDSGDDDDKPGAQGDKFIFLLGVLVLLAAVICGSYWLLLREGAVADGRTNDRPEGPYEKWPEEPGATTATGTGDTTIVNTDRGGASTRLQPLETPSPLRRDPGPESLEGPDGVGVQVGAYARGDQAEEGWQTLIGRHKLLQAFNYHVMKARVDGRTVYRLHAQASSRTAALDLCNTLKEEGGGLLG